MAPGSNGGAGVQWWRRGLMLAPGSDVGAGVQCGRQVEGTAPRMAGLQPIEAMAPVQTKLYRHY